MTNYPNDGLCQETSGFLFSHRCDRIAVKECVRCKKAICQDHGHSIPDGLACTTCLKSEAQTQQQPPVVPGAVPGAAPGAPIGATTPTGYRSRPYYDDPYFYGSHWYPGYGYGYGYGFGHGYYHGGGHSSPSHASDPASAAAKHDPNDFTEGDAASLRKEGDEAFESEMGES